MPVAAYKNDSLFVGIGPNNWPSNSFRFFYLTPTVRYNVLSLAGAGFPATIHRVIKLKNNLLILGDFDSAFAVNYAFVKNAVLFDGKNVRSVNYPGSNVLVSGDVINDTALISGGDGLFRFTLPDSWKKLTSRYFMGVYAVHDRFLMMQQNRDTLHYWKYGVFEKRLGNLNPDYQFLVASCKQGTIAETRNGLWKLDTASSKFTQIYSHYAPNDSGRYNLIGADSQIVFGTKQSIRYLNKDLGSVVRIRVDSLNAMGFDTVFLIPYWDRNRNLKLDAADTLVYVHHVTMRPNYEIIKGPKGYRAIIPDYNESEFILDFAPKVSDSCLDVTFTGTQYSRTTDPGITSDTLYFPLQTVTGQNVNAILHVGAGKRVRLNEQFLVGINLFHEHCSNVSYDATVTIDLEPGTQVSGSKPAYFSYNGNRLTYKMKGISYHNYQPVQLYLKYPVSSFTNGSFVKHKAFLSVSHQQYTSDDSFWIEQQIVGSYDPNAKSSTPEGMVTKASTEIIYHVEFQNLGSDYAQRVTVVDTLDMKIPVYEFCMRASSHPYTVSIRNNIVTWVFDNIHLEAKSVNEEKSKGYLNFQASLFKPLRIGDSVRNRAAIYFDYNSPVITNYAVFGLKKLDTIPPDTLPPDSTGGIQQFKKAPANFILYPNPAENFVQVKNLEALPVEFKVYNLLGKEMFSFRLTAKEQRRITTTSWSRGMYLMRSESGGVLKFLLE